MQNKSTARPKRRLPSTINTVENKLVSKLDKLTKFEEFQSTILPAISGQLKKGATAADLYKLYEALAAARHITYALTEEDPGKALAAIVDIQNRASGKPKEKVEVEHRYAKLSDDELDALIESRTKDVGSDDE